jgi:hypothetical protein
MQSASRRLGAAVYSESVGGLSLGCRVGLPRKFQLTEIVLKPKLYHSQLLADQVLMNPASYINESMRFGPHILPK